MRREIAAAPRLVVLGVGSREKGDDAAGVLCADAVRAGLRAGGRTSILAVAGGDAPESATGPIRRFRPTLVLIVDAALSRRRPGSVFFVRPEEVVEGAPTTHALPLRLLVRYLEETAGCRVLVLGIQPKTILWGTPPSAEVRTAAGKIAKEILAAAAGVRSSSASTRKGRSSPRSLRAGEARRCSRP